MLQSLTQNDISLHRRIPTPAHMPASSITLLTQVFHPDQQATSELLTDLFCNLAKKGYATRVIAGFTKAGDGEFPPKSEMYSGIEIRRVGIPLDYKRGYIRRAVHYLCFLVGASVKLWRIRKQSLVVAVTNPPIAPVLLWFLGKWLMNGYQVILHDVYPDGLVALGLMREETFLVRIWRWANRKALQKAKRVVVLGRDMVELVQSRYGVSPDRIIFIPNWSKFTPSGCLRPEDTHLHQALGMRGKFIIQYSGNMGLWHDLEPIVKAAKILNKHQHFHFLMIGDGMRRNAARQLAQQLDVKNITWLPFQPKESLEDSLSCCHVALISQREGLEGVAVPCKLYGILASGRATVAMVPKGSEIDRVITEEKCGVVVPKATPEALAKTLLELFQDSQRVQIMGDNAYSAFKAKYSPEAAVSRFVALWNAEVTHFDAETGGK